VTVACVLGWAYVRSRPLAVPDVFGPAAPQLSMVLSVGLFFVVVARARAAA